MSKKWPPEFWPQIRAEYEAGNSLTSLAKKHKVGPASIHRRVKSEAWAEPTSQDIIRIKALERAAGVRNSPGEGVDEQKKAEAIEEEAERIAEIIRKHREEPKAVRAMLYDGVKAHRAAKTGEEKRLAFDDLKAAKISSEILANLHALERKAWGLDKPESEDKTIVIERSYG